MEGIDPIFTPAWAVLAEGARIGIVTCTVCGAALVLDNEIDVLDLHRRHHGIQQER
jgi:hypothetical protein